MDQRAQTERRKQRNRERSEAESQYKNLYNRTRSIDKDADLGIKLKTINKNLKTSDELYQKVRKNLGGTAADAKFIRETLHLASNTSKLLNINTKPFDLKRTIRQMKRQRNGDNFFSFVTTEYTNLILRMPPTFTFFYGAIKVENLVLKKRKQRVVERLIETQAVTAKEKTAESYLQDTTPKEVEHIYKEIKKIASSKNEKNVPFFEILVDPNSFSQTVENIFHASFLIKEGQLGLKTKNDKVVITVDKEKEEKVRRDPNAGCQSIFSFSMKDYKNWISQYEIKSRAFCPRAQ